MVKSISSNSGACGADDGSPDVLHLLDDQTMEETDLFRLDPQESACSLCTVTFTDDPTPYFAVGTAYVNPEESEPSRVSPVPCTAEPPLSFPCRMLLRAI